MRKKCCYYHVFPSCLLKFSNAAFNAFIEASSGEDADNLISSSSLNEIITDSVTARLPLTYRHMHLARIPPHHQDLVYIRYVSPVKDTKVRIYFGCQQFFTR